MGGGRDTENRVTGVPGTKVTIFTNIFAGANEIMPVFKKCCEHTHAHTHTQLYVNRFAKVGGWLAFQHLVIFVICHSLGEVGGC